MDIPVIIIKLLGKPTRFASMKSIQATFKTFAIAACLLATFTQAAQAAKAPAWELSDPHGKPVKSSDFAGKVVILDFWATWCPPCKAEIPGFIELQEKYRDKGLVIVGVSLDEQGPAVVKPFMQQFKINYPIVMGDEKTAQDFGGVTAIPTTFIIDKAGNIVKKHVGFAPKENFEKEITPLL
jgi:thiol-disulfide isomerase/thioredoxin